MRIVFVLAVQHTPGVSVSGCQLHGNLVSRTHETRALVSTPFQFHRNWRPLIYTKRHKTIGGGVPKLSQSSAKNPDYTVVNFANCSGQTLVRDEHVIWKGASVLPTPIHKPYQFSHIAEKLSHHRLMGSVVGLKFHIKDNNCTLIVAWGHTTVPNKVYAEILPAGIVKDWSQIKKSLAYSKSQFDTYNNKSKSQHGYRCILEIHPTSGTPTVKATFTKAL
ncbi:PREDICTED: uncharacterized protein LOC18587019 [Theobroma cacao]|uniref:Uncharacterized protein LOC18587019 n=1 Tax=Theobroma cacao TaxID=3641 RepID=A0AB32WYM2_THECC|nr:PREDICTED: uncharacterized protein LOC18587019 [Theobroma cacao]